MATLGLEVKKRGMPGTKQVTATKLPPRQCWTKIIAYNFRTKSHCWDGVPSSTFVGHGVRAVAFALRLALALRSPSSFAAAFVGAAATPASRSSSDMAATARVLGRGLGRLGSFDVAQGSGFGAVGVDVAQRRGLMCTTCAVWRRNGKIHL